MRKMKNNKGKRKVGEVFLTAKCFCSPPFGEIKKLFHGRFPVRTVSLLLFPCSLFFSEFRFVQRKSSEFLAEVVTSPVSEDTKHFVLSQNSWYIIQRVSPQLNDDYSWINKAVEECRNVSEHLNSVLQPFEATDFYSSKAVHGTQQLSSQTTSQKHAANCST